MMHLPEQLSFVWMKSDAPYEEYAKFLGIVKEDGTGEIIAGNFEYHNGLLAAANRPPGLTSSLLFAAGQFSKNAEVGNWQSLYFNFLTPVSSWERIAALIKQNGTEITLRWGT